jgi:hypothetical protein
VDGAGRAALSCDLDLDGREDLLVSVLDGNLRVFRNVTEGAGNWVRLRLRGKGKNPLAIGAIVRGKAGDRPLVGEVASSTGYICAPDLRLQFGLGGESSMDEVTVRWPDGTETKHGDLAAGREHTLTQ